MNGRQLLLIAGFIYLSFVGIATGNDHPERVEPADTLRTAALKELQEILYTQAEWVKVHAAEYLLWAGYPEGVKEEYLREEKRFGNQPPYRIGIWRVLAQASSQPAERQQWTEKIREAFGDTAGMDRIHAAETLAKLQMSPQAHYPTLTQKALKSDNKPLAMYTLWAASYAADESVQATRHKLLGLLTTPQPDVAVKRMAAYILRHLKGLTAHQWQQLAQVALSEPENSAAHVYLLSAAFVGAPANANTGLFKQVHETLLKAAFSPLKGNRTEMAAALAERGTLSNLPVLVALLTDQNPLPGTGAASGEAIRKNPDQADVRAAAAYAILKIRQREQGR
ncbi:hypothetical protein GCM10023189_43940 [Nibrella saemangeumensis]|uniref:HEAT repeat domain-containing protein n=1 Tax=Nibrella saemangeumensis TaxID=1084526 RepID=A0ABP8NFE6_9BACT